MRTVIIIVSGLVLFGVVYLLSRWLGGNLPAAAATAAKIFIPLWFIAAGVNMWIGVSAAGYSVMEELPIFLVIFGLPSIVAGLCWWKFS
jgi:hypothetical protein